MSETNEALSERELEILRLVATGAANKEIARQLLISPNTVKVHLRNIFAKIGVTSRTEATLYAIQIGLIRPDGQVPAVVEDADSAADEDEISVEFQDSGKSAQTILEQTGGQSAAATLPTRPRRLSRQQIIQAALALLLFIAGAVLASRWISPRVLPQQAPTNRASTTATPSVRWASKESLPAGRKAMGAVEYNNSFYLIGGETAGGIDGSLLRYTPVKDEWQVLASKPVAVSDVQAALLGERIYVPGGRQADGTDSAAFEVYDPRQDTWDQLAPLPVPVSGYSLAAYEGRLFLFGGKSGEQYLDSVYEYQVEQNEWIERTPMKAKLAYAGAAVVGNRIFIVGGYDGSQALDSNLAYLPARDRNNEDPWEEFDSLPNGRYAVAICTLSNVIYIAGGTGSSQSPAAPPTLQYLPQIDQWTIFDSPAKPLGAFGVMLPLEGYLHFLGGANGQQFLTLHQSYQALYFNAIPLIQKDN